MKSLTMRVKLKDGFQDRYHPETAPFIEEGIRPLVVALSRWKEIEPLFSCEGHPGDDLFDRPYVEFTGSEKVVDDLLDRIEGTGWHLFYHTDEKTMDKVYELRPFRKKPKTTAAEIAKRVTPATPCSKRDRLIAEHIESPEEPGRYFCQAFKITGYTVKKGDSELQEIEKTESRARACTPKSGTLPPARVKP